MSERTVGISLLGCGAIGTGVARILHEQRDLIRERTGLSLDLVHVVDKDTARARPGVQIPIHADADKAIDDPRTQIVIELIGGVETAGKFVAKALGLGKPVVTANKSLLAARGPELFALARKNNSCIGFEASCAGGIPIINAILHGLVANRIDALLGIVNGTCNFILTRMKSHGWTYEHCAGGGAEGGVCGSESGDGCFGAGRGAEAGDIGGIGV